MSLFDLISSGVRVTNLNGTEANMGALESDGAEVESGSDDVVEGYEDQVETEEGSSGDESVVETSEELNTELLDTQEDSAEMEEVEQQTEEAEEAAVATEAFLANLYATKALGGLNAAHGELAVEHIKYMSTRLGLASHEVPAIDYGLESYSTAGGVAMNTEGAIESIKNFFIKIIDGILKGIAWILDKGAQLISKLFNNFEKMKKYADEVEKVVNRIEDNGVFTDKEGKGEYKSAGHSIILTVDGKITPPETCASILLETSKAIANKWGVAEFSKTAEEVTEQTKEEVSAIEKTIDEGIKEYENSDVKRKSSQADIVGRARELHRKVKAGFPFSNTPKVSSQEAARAGFKAEKQHEIHLSKLLPRNKVILQVTTDMDAYSEKDYDEGRAGKKMLCKVTSYKPNNKGGVIKITASNKSNLLSAITAIKETLHNMQIVKRKIDSTVPVVKKLKNTIWLLRTKYVAISKKAREGNSFMTNIRQTRSNISTINGLINTLREPGTSFSTYCLFEIKGLLDVIKYQANMYKLAKEKKEDNV